MDTEKFRIAIVRAYSNLISNIMSDMSNNERIIIESPDIGTVKNGSKAYHAEECRQLLSLLLTQYYSTKNLSKWNEFKDLLQHRLDTDLNYELNGRTTERIAKNWATNAVLKYMRYAESEVTKYAD